MTRRPWRTVTEAHETEGSSNGLNRAHSRIARWWELDLDCGHHVTRNARYAPAAARTYRRSRRSSDMLPAPIRVRCDHCPKEAS